MQPTPLHSEENLRLPSAATEFQLQSNWAVSETEVLGKGDLGSVWTSEVSILLPFVLSSLTCTVWTYFR